MQHLKVLCLIGILYIAVNALAAEVYDYEGKIITEEEINKEMDPYKQSFYSNEGWVLGCLGMSGGCLITCCGSLLLLIALGGTYDGATPVYTKAESIGIMAVGSIIFASSSYMLLIRPRALERSERNAAIERIKEKRHTQKQGSLNSGSEMLLLTQPGSRSAFNQRSGYHSGFSIKLPLLAGRF